MSDVIELPENIAGFTCAMGSWNGIQVERHAYTCTGRVLFPVERPLNLTWINAQFEEVGQGTLEARLRQDIPNPLPYKPRSLFIAPADMEVWGYSGHTTALKCATISFDVALLQERLGICASMRVVDAPRFRFSNDQVWTMIKLLSDTLEDNDPTAQLYGDSLTAAIAARIFERPKEVKGSEVKLSAAHLNDALCYLEARMPKKVELAELAKLAGLSQSHYCRAFKASTGMAPYQWQLQARIDRAKFLLLNTNRCLQEIADTTGFADTVHFGRTFRKMTGASPAAWRTDMLT
ncbi:AraC family transcriptional regulator [Massilia sp. Root418]|uniref:helix-turn-helix domain-containing protein n=1 Tax=Massilia sp. Root418 TaxID=1736532 RepID=UPI000AEC7DC5|nr:AraC family transcriptional regulator [Massilia sp. Root418]